MPAIGNIASDWWGGQQCSWWECQLLALLQWLKELLASGSHQLEWQWLAGLLVTCRIASCYASHCWRYHSEVASHVPCRQWCRQQCPVLPVTSPAILRVASKVASDAFRRQQCRQRCHQQHPRLPVMLPAILRVASDVASNTPYRQQHCQRRCMLLAITLSIAGNVAGNRWFIAGNIAGNRWLIAGNVAGDCWFIAGNVAGNCWFIAGDVAGNR